MALTGTKMTEVLTEQARVASDKYNQRYSNILYRSATCGKSVRYANELIDAALAVCGDPRFKSWGRPWGVAALRFLEAFK